MLYFSKPLKMLKDIEIYRMIRLSSFCCRYYNKICLKMRLAKNKQNVQNKMANKNNKILTKS